MSVAKRKKPNPPVSEPSAKPYEPTDQDRAAAKAHLARRAARTLAPRVKLEPVPSGGVCIEPDHPMRALWAMALQQVFGTISTDFAGMMLGELADAVTIDRDTIDEKTLNGVLGALHGINPGDEVEGMLAAQMVATHLAAMECLRWARAPGQTFEGRDMNLRHATKLTRTYTMQVESLKRYRSKGEQRVVVQHQHVNVTADQAAVQVNGGADPAPRGRGTASKPEEQSHAQADPAPLAYVPEPAMRCPDPAGDAVPAAGSGGESSVPDARRN
jgi:hypothetical protein